MTDFLRSLGETYGEWTGPNGQVAKWEIRDGALLVTDADDKTLALVPLDAIIAALRTGASPLRRRAGGGILIFEFHASLPGARPRATASQRLEVLRLPSQQPLRPF